MWCGECFRETGTWRFPVREFLDEDGELLETSEEEGRFRVGRNGDHLASPFQCELCHFRNMQGRNPDLRMVDDYKFMCFARRASLDAFWSRESSTVLGNLREAQRDESFAREFGIASFTPPMGPFPLEDSFGMRAAIAVLRRSLDKGRYEEHVQPRTFRKPVTYITNVTRAGVFGMGTAIGVDERGTKIGWTSEAATHSPWFGRFMAGIRLRVGEVVKQDEPVTIEILKAALDILEKRWEKAETYEDRLVVGRMGLWYCGGFCAGLRGEEMLLIELAGTLNSLPTLDDTTRRIPYFLFAVTGKTKQSRESGARFWIPIAGKTQGTGLQPGVWAKRYGELMLEAGRTSGYLFTTRRDGSRSRLMDFAEEFYEILEAVQAETKLIPEDTDVRDAFGIWRSLRKGVTAHAINMEVREKLIRLINRWRDERNAEGKRQPRDILQVYAILKALIPTTVKYSHAL